MSEATPETPAVPAQEQQPAAAPADALTPVRLADVSAEVVARPVLATGVLAPEQEVKL